MSNYVQTTFFTPKDSLPPSNPAKTIFGAAYDVEFGNISTAISSKFDTTSISAAPIAFNLGTAALPGITFIGETGTGWSSNAGGDLIGSTAGLARLTIGGTTGGVTIAAPTSGHALVASGIANSYAVQVIGSATSGQSLGLLVQAGTTIADAAFAITNQGGGTIFAEIFGDGSGTLGPTSTKGFSWNAAGNVTIALPTSGASLSLNGTAVNGIVSFTGSGINLSYGQSFSGGTAEIVSITASNLNIGTTSANSVGLWTNSSLRLTVSGVGAVSIAAPSSATALTVNGTSAQHTAVMVAGSTAGSSFGLLIEAGTNSSDAALEVLNQAASLNLFRVFGDGSVQVGAPTGGNQGAGTINATGLFINGISVATNGKVKAAATNRISTTTATNDPDLSFAIPVAGTYKIEVVAPWSQNGSVTNGISGDINFSGTITAGGQSITYAGSAAGGLTLTGAISAAPGTTLAGSPANVGSGVNMIVAEAVLVAGSAGTVAFAWAQAASVAVNTTLLAGGMMTVTRIA